MKLDRLHLQMLRNVVCTTKPFNQVELKTIIRKERSERHIPWTSFSTQCSAHSNVTAIDLQIVNVSQVVMRAVVTCTWQQARFSIETYVQTPGHGA